MIYSTHDRLYSIALYFVVPDSTAFFRPRNYPPPYSTQTPFRRDIFAQCMRLEGVFNGKLEVPFRSVLRARMKKQKEVALKHTPTCK